MKIEVLFPEVCNLYGELENIGYLKRSCPEAEVVSTALTEEPLFATEVPDLIYMGTMTEKAQIIVRDKLEPYKARIEELIDGGAVFLITGNALEIFGGDIREGGKTAASGLGIFDTYAERDMLNRFNSLYLGNFDPGDGNVMKIAGFKSQFTHSYPGSADAVSPLFETERGPGLNPDIKGEGIRKNNFMASYVIGPLLILNPPFARYILRLCGADDSLAFEDAAMDAYNARIKEYSDPETGFYY